MSHLAGDKMGDMRRGTRRTSPFDRNSFPNHWLIRCPFPVQESHFTFLSTRPNQHTVIPTDTVDKHSSEGGEL